MEGGWKEVRGRKWRKKRGEGKKLINTRKITVFYRPH
jgi:hypothetical protein